MRLSRDHITTLRQTRLAIPRATRYTAIRIPRCKLPGVAKRVARHLPAHASAAAPGGGCAPAAAATAAQKTATKRHIRGIAAKESEEDQVLAVPAETQQHDAGRRGALDAGFPARLDWQNWRQQA